MIVSGGFWEGFGEVLASKLARKLWKNRKMTDPGGSRGPPEFRAFLALIFELFFNDFSMLFWIVASCE